MPKETFFRLPRDKQERILEAAHVEFSQHSLKEASVSSLIKLADIPRGSFYQYFEDMRDLYYYYFEFLREDSFNSFVTLLKAYEGDLFKTLTDYHKMFLETILMGENADFYRHFFLNMDDYATRKVSKHIIRDNDETGKCPVGRYHRERYDVFSLIDSEALNVSSDKEMNELLRFALQMFFSSILHAYRKEDIPVEQCMVEAQAEFSQKINWLKYGVVKEGRC
ncbi:TetR family transcriptional regulator [Vagococcus lutrae]|uniref:HTH tetR-type domain-containing protein n=1 Tax=Vagococcus lutrae LBD1 TaxID=1408226 RepID=V6Q5S8_9ENTE|nr:MULTISPECIES: TetR family transcriptional regulator [Vagococcus]EST90102.1 hypothetical protein T233_00667 [Vagococcus lutrae LBD1]MCO7151195.1 TetR family transcriptional regulator [Vagococcus lutrae]MDT2806633.1 TetR family transcriptional regulator [Vagococcus lutrae]MDT2808730.1 TetR family transcriptional regulator [Vagococcus lutrae]MDT2812765.1 TetR family transcriptional regulator [Vagococcus lutrae]